MAMIDVNDILEQKQKERMENERKLAEEEGKKIIETLAGHMVSSIDDAVKKKKSKLAWKGKPKGLKLLWIILCFFGVLVIFNFIAFNLWLLKLFFDKFIGFFRSFVIVK